MRRLILRVTEKAHSFLLFTYRVRKMITRLLYEIETFSLFRIGGVYWTVSRLDNSASMMTSQWIAAIIFSVAESILSE